MSNDWSEMESSPNLEAPGPDGAFHDLSRALESAKQSEVGLRQANMDIQELKRVEEALRQSEARFREIIDALPAAIYTTDAHGRITHFNTACIEFSGRVPELGSDHWCVTWKLYHPDGTPLPHDQCPMAIALKEGRPVRGAEAIAERPDGSRIWFTPYPTPLFDSDGKLLGGVNLLLDITDRKRAEEVRSRLAAIVEFSDDAIISKDLGSVITSWNRGAERLFGYSAEEAVGRSVTMLMPEDRINEESEILARIQRGETVDHYETVRRRKDGTLLDISLTVSPLKDGQGRIAGASKIARNVTDRKLAEAALKRSAAESRRIAQELEEANRVKDEFLATLSHELRNPLNAMLGWAQMLRAGGMKPDVQERALEALERNARAQAQLIEDLLDVARITSGKLAVSADPVDLRKVVEGAIDTIKPGAAAKRVDMRLRDSTDAVVLVTGDANRLQQVVWNLLSNALKFTPSGGRIDVEMTLANGSAEIIVKDTGQGIEPAFLPHVFDRFRQADSTTARRHGGLGLGLSIVRHLVEAHGGMARATSDGLGLGATFTVSLPIRSVRPHSAAAAQPIEANQRQELAGIRALVVDDETDARELLRYILEARGAEVVTASSAGEALHEFNRKQFDVLVADIGMPDRDGYSLIGVVRGLSDARGGRIPAVAVTAYASVREHDRALEAGYNSHLAKPVDTELLVAAIADLMPGAPATP